MITGFIASVITSVAGFLFPILASFKALKANDVSQLTPWLMYWSVMGCLLFVEHWTYLFLQWVPLYKEAKMIVVLWMVLPQTQGATQLYLHYLHPQLVLHERDLDKLIFTLHQQAMQSGAAQLQRLYRLVQEILIGPAARAPENSATPTSSTGPAEQDGFIANLLARFRTVPVGSSAETIPATLLAFISSYSRSATSMTPSSAADIVPSHLQPEERANYIALQKQKVNNWLQLLDQAMSQPAPSYVDASIPTAIPEGNESHTSLSSKKGKARSASGRQTPMTDSDFEDIGQDDILPMRRAPGAKTSARDTSSFGNVNTRQGWFWRSGRSASSTY